MKTYCIECGKPFEGSGRKALCSNECRIERKRKIGSEHFQKTRQRILEEDPDKLKELAHLRYLRHKKKHQAYMKDYRLRNKERIAAKTKQYQTERRDCERDCVTSDDS